MKIEIYKSTDFIGCLVHSNPVDNVETPPCDSLEEVLEWIKNSNWKEFI